MTDRLAPGTAPTIVMLHPAPGADASWAAFGEQLAAATGCGVFHAGSGPALEVLPKLLESIGFQRGILLGRGEGASMATEYLGAVQDHRVRGLVLISPRFFAEDPAKDRNQTADIRESIAYIRVPILIVQGTAAQIQAAEAEAYCPVDVAPIDGNDPDKLLAAVAAFIKTVRNED